MITDDSDVPGKGKWENNFYIGFEGSKNNYFLAFPAFDINYGLGDRIQLKCEMPWVAGNGEHIANKYDHIGFGLKYEFLDEDSDGVSFSAYPQPIISFNPEDHAKNREFGIVLPIAASKQILKTGVNVQVGYQILGSESQIFYGIVFDRILSKYFLLLGEIHETFGRTSIMKADGEEGSVFFKSGTFINIGLQFKPDSAYYINLAIGKDMETSRSLSSDAKYYAYLGLQLNL